MVHPVIRVVCFLVLAGFVAFGGVYDLALGFTIVVSVILFKRLQSLELSIRIIRRMRWLFLSILVVYLWFTPGKPLVSSVHPMMPTVEGMQMGLLRVFSLILIVLAVNYFVSAIARNKLVEAIMWLLYPINWFGIDHKQIALRIALVLELIPRVQHIVLDMKQQYVENISSNGLKDKAQRRNVVVVRVVSASQLVEQLFERVVSEAVKMPSEQIAISIASRPPMLQWFLPIGLTTLFWAFRYYM